MQSSGFTSAENRKWFVKGLGDGIPICLGYLAVSFAVGVRAHSVPMNAVQSFFMSIGMVASAGEFAAMALISAGAGLLEVIITTVIVNLRYFLMSCSLTQKLPPRTSMLHRFILSYCITDEIFGLSSAVSGYLCPFYTYGITVVSVTGWCVGTVVGVLSGNIMPVTVSTALQAAMFGMFMAIVIPPAKKDHFTGVLIVVSMVGSLLFTVIPVVNKMSSGFRIIILTVLIAGIAAAVRPFDPEDQKDQKYQKDKKDKKDKKDQKDQKDQEKAK